MKKKQLLPLLLLSCLPGAAVCQEQSQQLEQKQYYELKGYFEGKEIDQNRALQEDTVFFVNTKILVFPSWFECEIGGRQYVVIRYPNFSSGTFGDAGITTTINDSTPPVYTYKGLWKCNGKSIAVLKEDFEKLEQLPVYNNGICSGYKLVSGQLTLPFKLRPKQKDQQFQITTDVTIGAYLGVRKRLSKRADVFLTIPFTLGLSYININDNTTSTQAPEQGGEARIVPGITWATGFMIQIERFNLGFLLGRDYASQVGRDWIYHDKTWYSFGLGYSFSNNN